MISLKPFRAVRPSAAKAREFSVPRLDHLPTADRASLAAAQPRSLAALLQDGSADGLSAWLEAKSLIRHAEPTMYMHRHVRAGERCTGVVALVEARSFTDGPIRAHRAREGVDAAAHAHLRADSVIVGYEDDAAIQDLVEREVNDRPLFHVLADDGATHTLWAGTRAPAVAEAFARVSRALVLEGDARLPGSPLDAPVLTLLLPLSQVRVRSSMAVVSGAAADTLRDHLQGLPALEGEPSEPPPGFVDAQWGTKDGMSTRRRLQLPAPQRTGLAADALSHGRLMHWLQACGLGGNPLTWRPGVASSPGAAPAPHEVLLALPRPSMAELLQVAGEGTPLPSGSTWVEPRIRSGLWMAERSEAATTIAE